ncbi:PIH1 domain-containing protein 2 isoform X2 [Notolabrus celidotus]|uniref:PIH1 domain-containing protein 2 isoform X2 n=1 Tax=Notolabrus celidotus TaxID=1203425 RepID=UPI0014900C8E|nr:PIH1 domain-containing protein 2 isoform X2 [Notolabrus celidotus]
MSSTGSTKDVLQQVNQFWSMLDDLSENDPEFYRKFIEKQMKDGAEFSAPPELDSSLCTEIEGPTKGSLYINICSWKRVPAPQDPSRPVPVCTGKLETDTDEGQGCYTVLDVAFNPAVLKECQKAKNEIFMLALSFIQQQHGLRLSQQYNVISCCPKSCPDDLYRRLGFQKWPNNSKQPDTANQTPAALLQQIASLRSETQDQEPAAQIIPRPAEYKKMDLIQVISSTFVQPQKPEYQLGVKTDTAGVPRSLELTVELPKVSSMSECQLSISKDDVLLEVEDVYYLLLEFPNIVNEDTASAIFNKKKQNLTLKVDVSEP